MIETITLPTLSLSAAEALIAAAKSEAEARSVALCFAVTDSAGQLVAFQRMDNAGRISIDVAIGKARTAALFGKPMRDFAEMIDAGHASMLSVPDAVMIAGGVPVIVNGSCVGALGVSGATGDVDDAIASAAVQRLTEGEA